jgi:uncharacterized iron-regulated membrane protein
MILRKFYLPIIQIHKLSGSLLSLMFVVWFISGIVLIFEGFPHASREERFLHLSAFESDQFQNIQAPSSLFKGKLAFELYHGKPVYRVYAGKKAQKVYDAKSLEPIDHFSIADAKDICTSFKGFPVERIEEEKELDQWVPWSYYKPLLPFYKCYVSDPSHTVLYISKKSGEIIQETNRKSRWMGRIGAIPHWIYFKQLRTRISKWRLVVIILASLGLVISLSGIYAGVIRKKSAKLNRLTPYKKFWYKWHHLVGFFFGFFVFTFVLSGLISVTSIPDWMVGVKSSEEIQIQWDQKLDITQFKNTSPQEIYHALRIKEDVRKIEWHIVLNQPQFWVFYENYQIPEVYVLRNEQIVPLQPYSINDIQLQAKKIIGDLPFAIHKQEGYDYYYSSSAMLYMPLPAYKIEVGDTSGTWLYINPTNGDLVKSMTKNTRLRRWLYRFLHTFDSPFLKKHESLRKSILLILSLAGLVVSISGLVLSVKWFKRKLKKYKRNKACGA